jgi:GGDEF domain-containing protein/putative methionine-R-sulfoxide reductase with GAF domain
MDELSRQIIEKLEFVNEITKIVLSSPDVSRICKDFASRLSRRMPVDWVGIVTIKEKKLYFQCLSSRTESFRKVGDLIPLKGTATEYVATTKQTLYEPDISQQRRFWAGENFLKQGLRSIVYIPLLAKDSVFGALLIASTRPNAFGDRELTLLCHAASQIALPIKNAILLDEIKKQNELLETINDLTKVLLSDAGLDDVYHAFSEELRKLVEFDRLSITIIEGDDIRYFVLSQRIKTDIDNALSVTERVRKNVEEEMKKRKISLTISFGLSSWQVNGTSAKEILEAADAAAFEAKRLGGNQCILSATLASSLPQTRAKVEAEKNI